MSYRLQHTKFNSSMSHPLERHQRRRILYLHLVRITICSVVIARAPVLRVTHPKNGSVVVGSLVEVLVEYFTITTRGVMISELVDSSISVCAHLDGIKVGCFNLIGNNYLFLPFNPGKHCLKFFPKDVDNYVGTETHFISLGARNCSAFSAGIDMLRCELEWQQLALRNFSYLDELETGLLNDFAHELSAGTHESQVRSDTEVWVSSMRREVEVLLPQSNIWSLCERCG